MTPSSKKKESVNLDNIALIGGGRWARVLAEVLYMIVPETTSISIYSLHNSKGMEAWVSNKGFQNRLDVYAELPTFSSNTLNGVIVVNAAKDHEATVMWALQQECPVLVEKPFCLNFSSSQNLARLALNKDVYLATAHVFLFARYVDTFSALVRDESDIESIKVLWMDPESESRYGEAKNYDASLPIYSDWLPHILSILGTCILTSAQLTEKFELFRGGAHLNMQLTYGQTPCAIELIRGGSRRRRIIEVITGYKKLTLDFSSEPGLIYDGDTILCADQSWSENSRPVAKMLKHFLIGACGGVRDPRLDLSIGLNANSVIDQVAILYRRALKFWLGSKPTLHKADIVGDVRYALTERLKAQDPTADIPIDQRVNYVCHHLKSGVFSFNDDIECSVEKVISNLIDQGKTVSYIINGKS